MRNITYLPSNYQRKMSDLLKGVETIIFDFGNVLIDLDYPRVIREFQKVARKNQNKIEKLVVNEEVLTAFETGKIGPKRFRAEVSKLLDMSLSDIEFDEIWNSMLKKVSKERLGKVLRIRKKFKTCILSNSNIIHEVAFEKMVLETTGVPSIRDYVDKAYFSHEIGMRKPDAHSYELVIADLDQNPSEMLFLDDRLDNIDAARNVGMKAVQIVQPEKQINEIFGFE